MIITLDGPTASGKSTVGRLLAKRLGFYYIYSGLFYRSLAYLLINKWGYKENTIANPSFEHIQECFDPERFFYQYEDQLQERIFYDAIDLIPHLKNEFLDKMTSIVSTNVHVRDHINSILRDIARDYSVVVDGRDAGTVIFPDADLKFFITASVQVRAQRWAQDQKKLGNNFTLSQAIEQISQRDNRDTERDIAPLIVSDDAIVIDSSGLDQNQVAEKMMTYIQRNMETK